MLSSKHLGGSVCLCTSDSGRWFWRSQSSSILETFLPLQNPWNGFCIIMVKSSEYFFTLAQIGTSAPFGAINCSLLKVLSSLCCQETLLLWFSISFSNFPFLSYLGFIFFSLVVNTAILRALSLSLSLIQVLLCGFNEQANDSQSGLAPVHTISDSQT